MKPKFDINLIDQYKYTDKLEFECERCAGPFYIAAKFIKVSIRHKRNKHKYCSFNCSNLSKQKRFSDFCGQCSKIIIRKTSELKKSKSKKIFCCQSCAAKYSNARRTTGVTRSKLEIWLEEKLKTEYPNLTFLFNNKDIINSELDIYIEELKLAIELNGIFHYEPIFGKEKLASIQNNDSRKQQACNERNIELLIIDCSNLKYFKEKNCIKYWDIIKNIIEYKVTATIISASQKD